MLNTKNLLGVGLVVILALSAIFNPYTKTYLNELIVQNKVLKVDAQKSDLYQTIEEASEKYSFPPQDAKIDRVWKAMPGYNGLKVDVEASYKKMKKSGFDERKLVFTQISPKIHLDDLEVAPIYRGHPDKPMVSFLINVAWGNEYIANMLTTLEKHKVHATFFLEGRWAKENPELVKLIVSGGHELGNHSYSHPKMETLSAAETKEEIVKTNEVIEATADKTPKWFGPPSGGFRDETVEIASSLNLKTVLWTVDTIDWQKPSPDTIIQRVMTKVHPGAMILMHPTDSTDKALDQLIKQIKAKNLRIGTVSKLMDEERIVKINSTTNKDKDNEQK